MRKIYIMLCALLSGWASWAQDQQFTQFYALPTYMNPAFAGASVQSRISTQYRNQWGAIPGGWQSGNFAYDQYVHNLKSGVGVLLNYNKAGSGGLRNSSIAFQYAYEAKIKRNWFFRPSLQFGYTSRNIDFSKLKFYDQMIREGELATLEQNITQPVQYFDVSTGALTYGSKFWLGAAIYHLNAPKIGLYQNSSATLERKLSVHGGLRLRVKGNSLTKLDHHIVIAANYQAQKRFDQLDFGFYYEFSPVILGLWYRGLPAKSNHYGYANHDALAVLIGLQAAQYKIGYSYDVTVSTLGVASSAGTHELTLSYQWANKRSQKAQKKRIMPCAKF